jgi:hypothetical protein
VVILVFLYGSGVRIEDDVQYMPVSEPRKWLLYLENDPTS